jgi:hypothetical protein
MMLVVAGATGGNVGRAGDAAGAAALDVRRAVPLGLEPELKRSRTEALDWDLDALAAEAREVSAEIARRKKIS